MCIGGLKAILAERGLTSPFKLDGSFVLSSEPQPAVAPPTDADFALLLDAPPALDESA